MAPAIYDAVFEDARGSENTRIHNDGHELSVSLRGIDFVGPDFDGLSPVAAHLERARTLFTLQRDDLCSCRLKWTMPLAVERDGEQFVGALSATLVLGDPLPNGSISSEELALELKTPFSTLRSSGRSGWFEDELFELHRKLGEGARVRSCLTCAFSDYSPAGHGLFGGLACFRDAKADFVKVTDKVGMFEIWNRLTEYVQETYLCDQFQARVPSTGGG